MSLRLKPRDAKTVLVLSDIASSGLQIPSDGYLTGYPLPDSGYYALARTWSATEIRRPGAVWTHTLLVEFADLAVIRDAQALLCLFRRPPEDRSASQSPDFDQPLALAESALEFSSDASHRQLTVWARRVIAALYSLPLDRIVVATPPTSSDEVEREVLAIWSQQWPRLRRTFRFCTKTSADRSADKIGFDLQLLPESERVIRSRFPGAAYVAEESPANFDWVDHIVRDLEFPQSSGLRDFLQRVGSEVAQGRKAFAPLVRLHMLLTGRLVNDMNWLEALHLLDSELGPTAMSARALVAEAAARSASTIDEATLDFVLANLDVIDVGTLRESAIPIGTAVWRLSPERLGKMIQGTEGERSIATSTLAALEERELLDEFEKAPELVIPVLRGRPSLGKSAALWRAGSSVVREALSIFSIDPEVTDIALGEILGRSDTDLVESVISVVSVESLWRSLAPALELQRHSVHQLLPWLQVGLRNGGSVAKVLASGIVTRRHALMTIASLTSPDFVPNDYGEDPWAIASKRATGVLAKAESVYFSSYLLARALGPKSRSCADLVEASFDDVYQAAAENQIDWNAWSLLDERLPQPSYWQRWDRCKQIRRGVAQLYVRRNLSAASFARLGGTDQEFVGLVRAAAKEWNGKEYLRLVLDILNRQPNISSFRRHAIKDSLIGWG